MGFLRTVIIAPIPPLTAQAGTFQVINPGTTQLTQGAGAPVGFNGKKVQMGLNYMGLSGGYEFKNLWLTGAGWGAIDPANYNFDANGYPTKIVVAALGNKFYIPTQAQRSGRYVLMWDGEGSMADPGGTFVTGSLSSGPGSVNHRYEFTPANSTVFLVTGPSAVGSPTSYITNIRCFHWQDETAVLADPWAFGDLFLAALKNFGVVRMMNWFGGNGLPNFDVPLWEYRKPKTYAFFGGPEVRMSIYAGGTSNSGDNYTLLAAYTDPLYGSGGTPQDKQTIMVKWSSTAVGNNPTLAINGGAAYPVLRADGSPHTGGSNNGRPHNGLVSGLTFHAMLGGWVNNSLGAGANYLDNGAPPEILLKLVHEVGGHPYFVCPTSAFIPSSAGIGTDYYPALAAFCLANADSWMVPRFEGPNELWNSITNSSGFAAAWMVARNGGGKYYNASTVVGANGFGYNTETAPLAVTSMTISGITATFTYTGAQPAVGAKLLLSSPFGGTTLFATNGVEIYVTASGSTTFTGEFNNGGPGGTFDGTFSISGTSILSLNNPCVLSGTNVFQAGQGIVFSGGTLPSPLVAGTVYYVSATGLSGSSCQFAANWSDALNGINSISTNGSTQSGTHTVKMVGQAIAAQNFHDFYGEGASRTFAAIAGVYSVIKTGVKSTTKYRTLIGVKTATGSSAVNFDPRMKSRGWVLRTGGDPGSDWTNGIAIAQYITPDEYGSGTENTRVTLYQPWIGVASISGPTLTVSHADLDTTHLGAGVYQIGSLSIGSTIFGQSQNDNAIAAGTVITGGSDPTWTVNHSQTVSSQAMRGGLDLSQATSYIASLGGAAGGAQNSVATSATNYNYWGIWANGFGVKEAHGYEGGYSPDFGSGGALPVEQFRHAASYESALNGYTKTNYDNFTGIGTVTYPSGFHAYFPSCYNLYGYINGGYAAEAWAVLYDIYEATDPPQWVAIKAY